HGDPLVRAPARGVEQLQGGDLHLAGDDADRAAGCVRARAAEGADLEDRAWLDPAQPDVPADPDHHPALPRTARPAPGRLARRPRLRLRRLDAAVHPLDAAELRPR